MFFYDFFPRVFIISAKLSLFLELIMLNFVVLAYNTEPGTNAGVTTIISIISHILAIVVDLVTWSEISNEFNPEI